MADPLNAEIFVGVPSDLESKIADLCEVPGSEWAGPGDLADAEGDAETDASDARGSTSDSEAGTSEQDMTI